MDQQENASQAELLSFLPETQRSEILADLSEKDLADLEHDWKFWARPKQLTPITPFDTWAIIAGRGFGKTRTGSEWVRERVEAGCMRIALIAETQRDLEKVMVEGESGILNVFPDHLRPVYVKKPVQLTFPNGAVAQGFNASEPDQLRGPQFDAAWVDEFAKFAYASEVWDMLQFCLRLGDNPSTLITTTPRPLKILKQILAEKGTITTIGSTFENRSNLAPKFLQRLTDNYEGTRTGRQELHAELLDEAEGSLWSRSQLDELQIEDLPALKRIVIAIDPATTNKEKSDETGIVACGLGFNNRGYVIADESGRYSPADWAKKAIELYHRFKADRIVAEVNQGGDMVRNTIEVIEPNLPITTVHASRGKFARAEPVAALYEQGKVSHIKGLEQLEDQLVSWEPLSGKGSPDRLDALVWGMTDLMLQAKNEVLKTDVSELELKAMAMPDHWPRCYAMDVTDDQITVLWAAWNITIGQLIVYADYQKRTPEPALVASIIKARGGWMSGLYCTDKADPRVEYKPYSSQGMKLRPVKNDFSVGIGNLKQLIAQDQIKISTEAQSSLADLKNLRTDEKGGLDMKASPYVKCLAALVLSGRKLAKTKPTTPRLGGQMARNNKSIGGY
jgi:phage terminase large subunit-like protein